MQMPILHDELGWNYSVESGAVISKQHPHTCGVIVQVEEGSMQSQCYGNISGSIWPTEKDRVYQCMQTNKNVMQLLRTMDKYKHWKEQLISWYVEVSVSFSVSLDHLFICVSKWL